MPIVFDGTTGLTTPGITLGSTAVTASANQINSSAEDVNSENRIINGDFDHWQRASSVTGAGMAADRWTNSLGGGTVVQSIVAFALGDTLGSTQPTYHLRQTVSGQTLASHYALTQQKIESVRSYAGQTITILGWAKRFSGSGDMSVEATQNFGSGGSPSASVLGTGVVVPLTSSWAPFAVVINVPTVTGKVLGSLNNDCLVLGFWTSAGADNAARAGFNAHQTIAVDLWGIHIRVGTWTAADTSLYRPRSTGVELALCERYCQQITVSAQSPVAGSTSVPWNNRVRMRATPVLTVVSTIAAINATVAGDTIDGTLGGYFGILASASAGYIVGRRYRLDAEL